MLHSVQKCSILVKQFKKIVLCEKFLVISKTSNLHFALCPIDFFVVRQEIKKNYFADYRKGKNKYNPQTKQLERKIDKSIINAIVYFVLLQNKNE